MWFKNNQYKFSSCERSHFFSVSFCFGLEQEKNAQWSFSYRCEDLVPLQLKFQSIVPYIKRYLKNPAFESPGMPLLLKVLKVTYFCTLCKSVNGWKVLHKKQSIFKRSAEYLSLLTNLSKLPKCGKTQIWQKSIFFSRLLPKASSSFLPDGDKIRPSEVCREEKGGRGLGQINGGILSGIHFDKKHPN